MAEQKKPRNPVDWLSMHLANGSDVQLVARVRESVVVDGERVDDVDEITVGDIKQYMQKEQFASGASKRRAQLDTKGGEDKEKKMFFRISLASPFGVKPFDVASGFWHRLFGFLKKTRCYTLFLFKGKRSHFCELGAAEGELVPKGD